MLATLILGVVSMLAGAALACCFTWSSAGRSLAAKSPAAVTAPVTPCLQRLAVQGPTAAPPEGSSSDDTVPPELGRARPDGGTVRRHRQQCTVAGTMSEELAKYNIKELQHELKEKKQLVGGLKGDLIARLLPLMADGKVYEVAKQIGRAIPIEALRSNQQLFAWCAAQ